jgi:DNA polymerase-3 subunit delta'
LPPFNPEAYPQSLLAGFKAAFKSGNFSHALLIHGPRGVGKVNLALAMARSILCEKRQILEPCVCASCRRIEEGNHPDVLFYKNEEETAIKIAQVREWTNWARFRPLEGERKVLILRSVENLGDEALNAFLKLLEEPPESTTILLVTEAPTRLKGTLLSRCFQLALRPLFVSELKSALLKKGVPAEEAHYVSLISQGIWQEAEEKLVEKRFHEDDQKLVRLLSLRSYELPEEVLGASGGRKTQSAKRDVAEEFLGVAETFLRDVLLYQACRQNSESFQEWEEQLFFKHRKDWIERKALEETSHSLFGKLTELENARRRIFHNANPKLSLMGISETLGAPFLEPVHG